MDKLRATSDLFGDCLEEDGVIYIGNSESKRELTTDEDAQVTTKAIELQAEYDSQQYSRDRATDYPAIADQLDDIFHNGIDGWKATIQLTKDKYPKGGN
jgi:hypothetical protein